MRVSISVTSLLFLLLAGCTTSTSVTDLFSNKLRSTDNRGNSTITQKTNPRSIGSSIKQASFSGVYQEGTGSYVSSRAPTYRQGRTKNGGEGYTLNLLDAPIKVAVKSVLGDILGRSYAVDSRVQGTISLQTGMPVSKGELIEIFETALAANNVAIVQNGSALRIVPFSDALTTTPSVSVPSVTPRGPGVRIQVFELRNIAASEMRNILEPITRTGAILRVDNKRNYIMVAGTGSELNSVKDAINVFDLDWMRGRSIALHPLKTNEPAAIVRELENVFGVKNNGGSDVIRFIANERLNSVLVITSRPQYLRRAARWIAKLDTLAKSNTEQLFVYQIQNRPAKELANILKSVLSGGSTSAPQPQSSRSVAPDLQEASVSGSPTDGESNSTQVRSNSEQMGKTIPSVVADEENNALLISTTAKNYRRIEQILRQLDVRPTQVLIEVVIAEVTLNDELKFGLRWAIQKGGLRLGLSDVASGFAGAVFPGFSWGFLSSNVQVTLNALSSITDVKVISSPNLMALNNQKAILQVGDQVPIVTQQATGTLTANAPIVNSVELKDTGIILTVVPRVNKSGRVLLDIQQEVSSVVRTTSSGIDSPTIQQRKISTKVVVNDGESIALGGLIQERNTLSRGQIPVLGNVPIIGNLFKNKTDTITRTELIIFIKPQVIRNVQNARDVTSEFRKRLNFETAINKRRGGKNTTEQDLKRLKY